MKEIAETLNASIIQESQRLEASPSMLQRCAARKPDLEQGPRPCSIASSQRGRTIGVGRTAFFASMVYAIALAYDSRPETVKREASCYGHAAWPRSSFHRIRIGNTCTEVVEPFPAQTLVAIVSGGSLIPAAVDVRKP